MFSKSRKMHCEYEMWSLKMHGDSEKPNIQTKCKYMYIYGNDLDKIAVKWSNGRRWSRKAIDGF